MGVVGSLGFALLFGIRGTKPLGCIALGSCIGWVVYLVSVAGGHGKAFGMLASSLVIAICSEATARLIKTPVILLLVPMLIPEIPGGDLYYTMYSLIEGDSAKFASLLQLVLAEAGYYPGLLRGRPHQQYLPACAPLCAQPPQVRKRVWARTQPEMT